MVTTTPNYGWPVPTSTDLVKDGATAIEALGDAIDATVFGLPVAGLTLIKTQTIGTAVSSVNVTSAFSATYDNYLITVAGGVGSASGLLQLQMGATVTGYYYQYIYSLWNNSILVDAFTTGTKWLYMGGHNASGLTMHCQVLSPNLAKPTRVTALSSGSLTSDVGSTNGLLNNSTQYTDFTITPASGTLTGGTIRVYGYKN